VFSFLLYEFSLGVHLEYNRTRLEGQAEEDDNESAIQKDYYISIVSSSFHHDGEYRIIRFVILKYILLPSFHDYHSIRL
jgi:hypothetical protein